MLTIIVLIVGLLLSVVLSWTFGSGVMGGFVIGFLTHALSFLSWYWLHVYSHNFVCTDCGRKLLYLDRKEKPDDEDATGF